MIMPRLGLTADRPSSRPTASEEVTTALAPDWRSSEALSSSRTATTTWALGLSWRTVSMTRIAESSRSKVMITSRALMISARRRISRRVASPSMAA